MTKFNLCEVPLDVYLIVFKFSIINVNIFQTISMVEKYTTVCWALLGTGRNKQISGVSLHFLLLQKRATATYILKSRKTLWWLLWVSNNHSVCLCAFKSKILLCVSNDFHIIIQRQTTRKKIVTEALVICIMLSLCPFIKQIKNLFIQIIRRSIWWVEEIQYRLKGFMIDLIVPNCDTCMY